MAATLSTSTQKLEELLSKSKKLARGSSLEDAGIDASWLAAYATITRRSRNDRDFGVSRHPYELGPGVSPFAG
jgi:hypothetical protein